MPIRIKRIYGSPTEGDGKRILIDRLWPRGIRKDQALLYSWMKDIAPSHELRKNFGHVDERWNEFRASYRKELCGNPLIEELRQLSGSGTVTLLFSARNEEHNNAVVLKEVLDNFSDFEKECGGYSSSP